MSSARGLQLELDFHGARPKADHAGSRDLLESQRRRIAGLLSFALPAPVDVTFTDNRSTMISFRSRRGRIALRLHRMFRSADDGTLEALARYLRGRDVTAESELDSYIAAHRGEIRAARARRTPTRSALGDVYDLEEILAGVSARYFGGETGARIHWGRRPQRRKRRRSRRVSRALATYCYDDRTIRVNPVLDSRRVPRYVVEWVVYHELLHHVLPVERAGKRSRYHTNSFRALERGFERYEDARRWEEENAEWLLR
ncbi:MAG: hypothetical protein R6V85_09650 [Polyangia bacterium]